MASYDAACEGEKALALANGVVESSCQFNCIIKEDEEFVMMWDYSNDFSSLLLLFQPVDALDVFVCCVLN